MHTSSALASELQVGVHGGRSVSRESDRCE
ncbi:hypothetical protein HNQ53_002829 [Microbulbifer hydrolyticus]|uniref:Uncharacterized protein n=1 Tax=Microbulbifer hydrolyticus TaxID=48074 RepID=A0AA89T5H3_9GAMM|nr:hypothetical protein [Microbulbifer hydrolyticus]